IFLDFEEGGKGFAVKEGFRDALKRDNDLIGFVDADMATSPEAFSDVVRKSKNYDGIIASRGLKESVVKTSLMRKITSRGFNFLTRSILFLNFSDTQCGAKIFKRKAIEDIIDGIGITQWAFDIDLLFRLKKKGFKIGEIPTKWEDKEYSKLNLTRVPLQMFLAIIRLRIIYSPFSIFTKVLKPVSGYFWRITK
ncbi:MAG: glycosyltransferase, partial [Nanoarchaeota archaeon]|nr:glycosyltransferase [Nanoarchaeota archaeon]